MQHLCVQLLVSIKLCDVERVDGQLIGLWIVLLLPFFGVLLELRRENVRGRRRGKERRGKGGGKERRREKTKERETRRKIIPV